MIFRLSVDFNDKSPEAKTLERKIAEMGFSADVLTSDVYSIRHDFSDEQMNKLVQGLHNETAQSARINRPFSGVFDWALEIGYLPGVTDNVAHTVTEIINDMFGMNIGLGRVFSSKMIFIKGSLSRGDVERIAKNLTNTLIQRFHIKPHDQYVKDGGMDYTVPEVHLKQEPAVIEVSLDVSDEELAAIGKNGIIDPVTKTRRGPLALDMDYLLAIKNYFKKIGRNPTDIELESLAQTWSEHCKHTYFAAAIDGIEEGIFSRYIKRATNDVREKLGKKDFCVSVFKDNSGAIIFDDDLLITHKVETHNTPSTLDPFGGAITGIVGVNRDTLGFGMGAKPVANVYGFCVGLPEDSKIIYRNKNTPALAPKRIFEGVVKGVNAGGNCSGIPTPQGFVYFDDSYRGKPLVFAGTVGIIPRRIGGKDACEKAARAGDNIVVIGGRVGKDGIHGATFSSEAMDEGSPVSAVQIGDPITQKKLSDAIVKEARDLNLYNSITDNGAGGLSCSVAEMARECGGFTVDLERVPVKYPGLQPWEIWISESQERMTLAVPDRSIDEFTALMHSRGVETAVIGKFTGSKAVVNLCGKEILGIDMDFLHNGLPKRKLVTKPYPYKQQPEPEIYVSDHSMLLEQMLDAHNVCSFEFISRQYDHEVQSNSIVKPLQGPGRVNGTASVVRPVFSSRKGVVLSQSLYPRLSEISAYDMAACAIDTAVRNCVAAGGDIDRTALLDNFCWCSSDDPERLAQLKDAARACYDYAVAYRTPFISGQDSMFNDFKGFDGGVPVKISALPTLLISAISITDNVDKTCTIDLKVPDDLIYVIGETKDECGGSEFYNILGSLGSKSPKVKVSRELYEKIRCLHEKDLLSACASVGAGGLMIALTKMSIAGLAGVSCDIGKVPGAVMPAEKIMYSETQGRFVVSIDPENKGAFENEMKGFVFSEIGSVRSDGKFIVMQNGRALVESSVGRMERAYKKRFEGW